MLPAKKLTTKESSFVKAYAMGVSGTAAAYMAYAKARKRYTTEDWDEWLILLDTEHRISSRIYHRCEYNTPEKHLTPVRGLNDDNTECRACGKKVPPGIKLRALLLNAGEVTCPPIKNEL